MSELEKRDVEKKEAPDVVKVKSYKKLYLHLALVLSVLLIYIAFHDGRGCSNHRYLNTKDDNTKLQYSTVSTAELPFSEQELSALGLTPMQEVKILRLNGKDKTIKGRFLHITDMHPDIYYKPDVAIHKACHRKQPLDIEDRSARFGNAMMGCDGPPDLMYWTLDWVDKNLGDKIDFVVWTGDNVRHDNDRKLPRTEREIFDVNREASDLFIEKFKDHDSADPREFNVKVIPSLGNNDVFPHNMYSLGPTLQTRELYNIWRTFIPPEQQNTFDISTSFFVEVIPGKLAVISFNTMYLFKGNPLVDNCSSKKQPGHKLLLWLGYTLEELRSRGMKVWLSGHVPPIPKNYDSSCFNKLAIWLHEYNDIILGGFYGHMNLDHFIPVDGEQAWRDVEMDVSASEFTESDRTEDDFLSDAVAARQVRIEGAKPVKKVKYMDSVRDSYYADIANNIDQLSKKDPLFERYSLVHVGTSIIPTFNPGFRIWEYNITALQTSEETIQSYQPWESFFHELEKELEDKISAEDLEEEDISILKKSSGRKKHHKKKDKKNWWKKDKTFPKQKPKRTPPGPAYKNQLFSPLRFVQYYADLKQIDNEYRKLLKEGKSEEEAASIAFKYQVEYASDDEPYAMDTVLVKDYVDVASKLAKKDALWETFLHRAFCSCGYENQDQQVAGDSD